MFSIVGGRWQQGSQGVKHASVKVPPRRDEALAYIIDRLVRTGTSPSYEELGRAIGVSKTRAGELVNQLIAYGFIEKVPGAIRALRVRDVVQSRGIVEQFVRSLGWAVAEPLGDLQQPLSNVQLPTLSPFTHLPEAE